MFKYLLILAFLGINLISFQARADDIAPAPVMQLPVDCELGWNCWIANYVDHDQSEGDKDYTCGAQTYDAHKGTDFMIRSYREMQGGVIVRAAADAVVVGTRDGMKDVDIRRLPKGAVNGKECGNGIRLNHGNGWFTQYCHLRKNSVRVKKAQKVRQGDILGFVGSSGLSMFPHLHFQVEYIKPDSGKRRGAIVDPFVGVSRNDSCKAGDHMLWPASVQQQLDYKRVDIFDAGYSATKPSSRGLIEGLYDGEVLSVRSPNLILWGRFLHVKKGDEISYKITDPEGKEILDYNNVIDRTQAYRSLHAGLRRTALKWDEGTYKGFIELKRQTDKGMQTFTREATITLR